MTLREPSPEHPDDLAGLPEELLRHSLLLFTAEDEAVATAVDQSGTSAGEPVEQTPGADLPAETTAASDLTADRVGPTYHQQVKRELADYLRNRSSMADQHREAVRRQGAVKRQRTPDPSVLPGVTPAKSPASFGVDLQPRPAVKTVVPANSIRTSSDTQHRHGSRPLAPSPQPRAEPNPFQAGATRKPPPAMSMATLPTKDCSDATVANRGPLQGPDRQSHLQLDQPEAKPTGNQFLIHSKVPVKRPPDARQRDTKGQRGLGQLTLEELTLERQKKRSVLSTAIEPLAALQL